MVSSQVIKALKEALPSGQFIQRGTHSYDKLNSWYLSELESDLQPAYIFQPRTKEEVVTFVQTIKPFIGDEKFAIRGAGCQPLPGCANIQDGITLKLSHLTGISIEDGIVRIGAGERWGTVYERLDVEGLGVCGSRSANGGIGGLALEGGLSFFSSREGFICDNVLNYEVVLASGDIVNANAHENSDLWIALRGGGNNFGIVTRFDFRTFKEGNIWGGTVFYFAPSFPSQIEALVGDSLHDPNASTDTHLMLSIGYSAMFSEDIMCLNQPYYTKAVENPAVLDPFTKIQPQVDSLNTMRLHSLREASQEQAASAQKGVRCAYMNITVKADANTLQAGSAIYTAGLAPIKTVENGLFSFTLQPYPISLLEKSASAGGNFLGLKSADGPLVSVLLMSYWKNKADDEAVLGFMKTALEKIKQEAALRDKLVFYLYMNYAFSHQDPISSYGAVNKAKLQEISSKYDPEGMFQRGCPGGFKLFPCMGVQDEQDMMAKIVLTVDKH
ncbi:FAD-binding domain-containing protein [Mollisia scopiformis]|uniref:FAD-binding domain-containing protein n=1 Tax=Mollisia scopiformis TaxID=149040 RepID=A0A194X7Z8_MOLSC|nr:FAD-binding domain-containing protein [Mollisia scopiformis]KUJ15927.1 FAD-binding domain-containing protein [Mollisia scopiformis]